MSRMGCGAAVTSVGAVAILVQRQTSIRCMMGQFRRQLDWLQVSMERTYGTLIPLPCSMNETANSLLRGARPELAHTPVEVLGSAVPNSA
jgi:hypothetical protein